MTWMECINLARNAVMEGDLDLAQQSVVVGRGDADVGFFHVEVDVIELP